MQVQIQALSSTHNVKDFDCGAAPLNTWLATMAGQQMKRYLARTFVCVDVAMPEQVMGFFTLAVSEVSSDKLPNPNKYPRQVPVVRLGRFATDSQWQGHGLGRMLLLNAFERIAEIAETAGTAAVVVDAKDDKAACFYQKFGFIPLPDSPLQLVMPIKTLLETVAQAG